MTKEEAIEFGNMWIKTFEYCKDSNIYSFFSNSNKRIKERIKERALDKDKQLFSG